MLWHIDQQLTDELLYICLQSGKYRKKLLFDVFCARIFRLSDFVFWLHKLGKGEWRLSGERRNTDNEFYCYFSYIGPFWLIGLITDKLCDKRLRFHVNQGIALSIAEAVMCAAAAIIALLLERIPAVGVWLGRAVWLGVLIIIFRLSVSGMVNVAAHREKPLPVIGWLHIVDGEKKEYYKPKTKRRDERSWFRHD